MDISELLAFVVENKASDLHLSSGLPPMIRVHGDIRRINLPALEHKDVHAMVYDIMNDGQRKFYEENLDCDFSFEIPNLARFRVNAFVQQRGAGAVFRTIPSKVLSLEDLKAPKVFVEIANQPRGVVLVRADRFRQIDHAGGHRQPYQRKRAGAHSDGGRPHRIRA
jgi:twitching motility protein PilT